jgi:hypothetical protein
MDHTKDNATKHTKTRAKTVAAPFKRSNEPSVAVFTSLRSSAKVAGWRLLARISAVLSVAHFTELGFARAKVGATAWRSARDVDPERGRPVSTRIVGVDGWPQSPTIPISYYLAIHFTASSISNHFPPNHSICN